MAQSRTPRHGAHLAARVTSRHVHPPDSFYLLLAASVVLIIVALGENGGYRRLLP